jgi:hypothetical protein
VRPPRSAALWVPALAFVAGALAVVDAGGRRAKGLSAGSVYNETPEGLSLAFRYLRERVPPDGTGPGVSVLSKRVGPGALPAGGVLFRMRPRRMPLPVVVENAEDAEKDSSEGKDAGRRRASGPPPRLLTRDEEAWVQTGGRLVLGLDADYGSLAVATTGQGGPVRKVFPLWPGVSALDPGTSAVHVSGGAAEHAHTIFAQGSEVLLSRLVIGRGEILLLTAPQLLENRRLATADHLGLLEALAGEGRPVVFDEWTHGLGQDESLLALMLEWGLGPALVVASLAFTLLLWRSRTRLGPEEEDAVEARSEAVDLVGSLAQLYDRALSRREAAALHLQGFRRAVSLRTGLKGAALERRSRELLGDAAALPVGEREIPAARFLRALHAVNDGYRRLDEHAHTRRRP